MAAIGWVDDSYSARGEAYWLPPGGYGNGLSSTAWARIVDLPARLVDPVLARLTVSGIPAHLIPCHEATRIPRCSARLYQLWVDPHLYSAAEDLLMDVLRADQPQPNTSTGSTTQSPSRCQRAE